MKRRSIRVIVGIFTLSLLLTSCLMGDSEDIPDFTDQLVKDLETIDTYLAANNINAQQDVDGLIRYVIHRDAPTSEKPTIDSCARVNYAGFLLSNGQKFDEAPGFAFPVNGVIDGWKIGIPLLTVGDSATFYIPSGLGYSYAGWEPEIPPNANLMFHVGLTDVGESYSNSDRSCH